MSGGVLDLVGWWAEAELHGDADALDKLLAADFVAVGPRGFVLSRQQWLARYRSGELRNSAFEVRDPQAREYGSAAVVVGSQVQRTTHQGRDVSAEVRATLVAVRQEDRWLLAGVHLSPIAGPL
ncbi:nuclear transport factor 2 family protein [Micromonospora yasonensis]|uniref:nuclear transport factor 2 family protein n=1 Tax=Micromonospora yasonensis TaxID=1128667 RepID=UPI00222F90DD|nr:nuclear transport factor 2 family protein [Micromonospora yasonensis]MCW3841615.1 nuclear transport factor 2 family protein [Micromonospora yasonensis]